MREELISRYIHLQREREYLNDKTRHMTIHITSDDRNNYELYEYRYLVHLEREMQKVREQLYELDRMIDDLREEIDRLNMLEIQGLYPHTIKALNILPEIKKDEPDPEAIIE